MDLLYREVLLRRLTQVRVFCGDRMLGDSSQAWPGC